MVSRCPWLPAREDLMTTDSSPNNDHPELPQAGEEIPPTEAQADFSAGPIGPHQLPTLQPVMISRYLKQGWQLLWDRDRKSTRLNSSHVAISYAVFCLKKEDNEIA